MQSASCRVFLLHRRTLLYKKSLCLFCKRQRLKPLRYHSHCRKKRPPQTTSINVWQNNGCQPSEPTYVSGKPEWPAKPNHSQQTWTMFNRKLKGDIRTQVDRCLAPDDSSLKVRECYSSSSKQKCFTSLKRILQLSGTVVKRFFVKIFEDMCKTMWKNKQRWPYRDNTSCQYLHF